MENTMIVTGFGAYAGSQVAPVTFGVAARLRESRSATATNPAFAPKPAPDLDTTPPRTS